MSKILNIEEAIKQLDEQMNVGKELPLFQKLIPTYSNHVSDKPATTRLCWELQKILYRICSPLLGLDVNYREPLLNTAVH